MKVEKSFRMREREKRGGCRMSSVRNKGIKCEECNKQERNWLRNTRKESDILARQEKINENSVFFFLLQKSCRDSDGRLICFVCQSESLMHSHHLSPPVKSSLSLS